MFDPEGSGGLRPVDPTMLGANGAGAEPDAPLRSTAVDTADTQLDANLVKPKGGTI